MPHPSLFIRVLFVLLTLLFTNSFFLGVTDQPTGWTYAGGTACGLFLGGVLMTMDFFLKKMSLRLLNSVSIGLFCGYFMALALNLVFDEVFSIAGLQDHFFFIKWVKIGTFLLCTYFGAVIVVRRSDEICITLPFVKFTPIGRHTKDLILDASALFDGRLIDLSASGLLDKRLVIPRFLLRELHQLEENRDELSAGRAKKILESVRKLEQMPDLMLRYHERDFPETKELGQKIFRLARLIDADIITADLHRNQAQPEGIKMINLHLLSQALKPAMQRGEHLKIKIQRYGKEDLQGIGYLEDGTMVVVNGGGNYIGDLISARVLSEKNTPSGRMIFCNVAEEKEETCIHSEL